LNKVNRAEIDAKVATNVVVNVFLC